MTNLTARWLEVSSARGAVVLAAVDDNGDSLRLYRLTAQQADALIDALIDAYAQAFPAGTAGSDRLG